jgi:hypothetical protein
VRSIDFTMILILGVIGEFASFKGLKLRTEVRILLVTEGRVLMRTPKQFRVAFTRTASLNPVSNVSTLFSWEVIPSIFLKNI